LSEALIGLYAWAVTLTGRPLVVPALAVCWLGFFASSIPALSHLNRENASYRVLGIISILAFMLLGYHAFPVFYWPFGAVAYLPVVSAALFLLFSSSNERWAAKPYGAATALALVAAAWSSEAGALLVLIYASFLAIRVVLTRASDQSKETAAIHFLLPVLAALPVLWMITHNNRPADGIMNGGDIELYHHLFASLRAAALRFVYESLAFDGESFDIRNIEKGVVIKILFFAGLHGCWATSDPASRRDRRWLPVLGLALIVTSFGMLAGGYVEFGKPCCDQHALVRQDLGFIAIAAFAIWMPPIMPSALHQYRVMAPVVLMIALAYAMKPRIGDLVIAYHYYFEPGIARERTWASGSSPGPGMTLYQPAPGYLFKVYIPDGFYRATEGGWANNILIFFGKETLLVQTGSGDR